MESARIFSVSAPHHGSVVPEHAFRPVRMVIATVQGLAILIAPQQIAVRIPTVQEACVLPARATLHGTAPCRIDASIPATEPGLVMRTTTAVPGLPRQLPTETAQTA